MGTGWIRGLGRVLLKLLRKGAGGSTSPLPEVCSCVLLLLSVSPVRELRVLSQLQSEVVRSSIFVQPAALSWPKWAFPAS